MNDRIVSAGLSVAVHLAAFITGGQLLTRPAQYGVDSGYGGIEVHLVAALPQPAVTAEQPSAAAHEPESGANPEEMQLPVPEKAEGPEPAPKSQAVGDGSSPVPGKDATTYYSPGGAHSTGRSRHLRTPAPPYPEVSRRLGQEGTVLLEVKIDKSGYPMLVGVKRSSGFPLLDDSAVKTVRRWKFEPARIGPVVTESTVRIPVRFMLKDFEKREGDYS